MIRTDHRDGLAILELGHGKVNALDLELCLYRSLADEDDVAVDIEVAAVDSHFGVL